MNQTIQFKHVSIKHVSIKHVSKRTSSSRNALCSRKAFSLVEVLIAILVLAIGLLGLGAIFPAVIAEQRNAFAVIEGENVASSAEALLTNNEFVDFSLISTDFNRKNANATERYSYEWTVPQDGLNYYGWTSPIPSLYGFTGFMTGLWSMNSNDSGVNPDITIVKNNPELGQIPVAARLFPHPYSGQDPKFVWDIALRREPSGDRLQAAIFVRRIDARIRVPKGYTLSDVLTNGGATALPTDPVLPVAIDSANGHVVVDDGVNPNIFYAAIQTLEVEVHPEHLDWLIFKNGRANGIDTSVGFAAKVGQILLDNTGVVRTVVGIPSVAAGDPLASELTNNRVVIVDPPFTSQQAGGNMTDNARPSSGNSSDPDWDSERASWVRQVIFTPRTPVAVRVVTLEESR